VRCELNPWIPYTEFSVIKKQKEIIKKFKNRPRFGKTILIYILKMEFNRFP
jgi:hypothetical protein